MDLKEEDIMFVLSLNPPLQKMRSQGLEMAKLFAPTAITGS